MPLKGLKRVNARLDELTQAKILPMSQKALYVAATVGAGHASRLTPIDTSYLVNSQYFSEYSTNEVATIRIGYSAIYAAAIHNIKANKVVSVPRENGNGYTWDPNGEPYFLTNGFEQNQAEIFEAFKRAMKL